MNTAKASPGTGQALFLFDVDSVLVEATGYLHALQDTVTHFSQRMGVGDHAPSEAEIRAGEAFGLTSEWDSAPTYIATLLVERLRYSPSLILPTDWEGALKTLGDHPMDIPHPDYTVLMARVGAHIQAYGDTAAQAARTVMGEVTTTLPHPQRESLDNLLDELFAHTHDFEDAPITQHFQHLTIGSKHIKDTYGTAPSFSAPAYLRKYDVPLLDSATREHLLAQAASGGLQLVLYTARPSLPPRDAEASHHGYSPEAEIAAGLVDLEDWPLIALGRLQWLAKRTGVDVETLVKPSPVQALAAIGAAISGQETPALEAAWTLHQTAKLKSPLSKLENATVHVFEDSAGGLLAVKRAVECLNTAGRKLTYHPYGITPATGEKAEAMGKLGVQIYPNVNAAVETALATLQ